MMIFISAEDKYYYYILDKPEARVFLKRNGIVYNVDGSYLVVDKLKLQREVISVGR